MSPRAVRILREASLIAAEDTRHTGKLLKHFEIERRSQVTSNTTNLTNWISFSRNFRRAMWHSSQMPGPPAINDPGYELVRAALDANYDVKPVPGPSAPITALTVSGLPTDSFLYLGYLPHKTSERHRRLEEVESQPYTLVFLESALSDC